jgi:hypothetical protein
MIFESGKYSATLIASADAESCFRAFWRDLSGQTSDL